VFQGSVLQQAYFGLYSYTCSAIELERTSLEVSRVNFVTFPEICVGHEGNVNCISRAFLSALDVNQVHQTRDDLSLAPTNAPAQRKNQFLSLVL